MTPDTLERLIAWVFPFRRKRGKRFGPIQPGKKAVGANRKFALRLGIPESQLRDYRTGKRPVPPWLNQAVQSWGVPLMVGADIGQSMADGTLPVKVTAWAKRVGADGMEIMLSVTGLPPGREVLGLTDGELALGSTPVGEFVGSGDRIARP